MKKKMSNIIRFRVRRKGLELTTLSAKEAAEKALAGFRPVSPEKTETFRKSLEKPNLAAGTVVSLQGEDGWVMVQVENVPPLSNFVNFNAKKNV